MTTLQWIRLLLGGVLVLGSAFFFITAVVGNYRFQNMLYRMHAAGVGDTLGLGLLVCGLALLSGSVVFTLKLVLVLLLLWLGGAVSSHLILHMEMDNGRNPDGTGGEKENGKR